MKKVLLLVFLFFGAQMYTFSQSPAPDFTVTDAHGVEHKLYADYLDQGKTVIIDLFFTSCPPCNAKAPLIQQLYVEWGEGNNDLQIIELSTLSSDTDAKILAYEAQHGLTYPGVSPAGGSITASAPFRTSGNFFGTPGFVVISPTTEGRTSTWVYNNSSLISNLDAAVAATGAVKPPVQATISGKVTTDNGRPISGVKVYLDSLPLNFATTDASGDYSLSIEIQAGQQYFLVGEKNDANIVDGISTFDMIKLSKDLLNVELLTPHQELAADLNNDGSSSTLDLIFMRKILLRIIAELPGRTSFWDFKSPDLNAPGFNSTSDLNNVNLIGVKFGDLDDSVGL